MASFENEIKVVLKTGKVEIGSNTTLKALKHGKAKLVVVASNADPRVKSDIEYYAKFSGTPIYKYEGTSIEMGTVLGLPYPVQALAVIDPGDSRIMELVES